MSPALLHCATLQKYELLTSKALHQPSNLLPHLVLCIEVLRVQVLDRRWFHGKRCLDIGCNEGVITLAAVQRFAPLSMLGVDIDGGLIKTACRYVPCFTPKNLPGSHL